MSVPIKAFTDSDQGAKRPTVTQLSCLTWHFILLLADHLYVFEMFESVWPKMYPSSTT